MTIETQIINATNGAIISVNVEENLGLIIGLIIAAFLGAGATWFIAFQTMKQQKKENDRTGTIYVFDLLRSEENKQAEDNLIQAYTKQDLYDGDSIKEKYQEDYKIIRRNYYKIGLLISENIVPDYPFYITFGHKLVQLYAICQKEIEKGQKDYRLSAAYFTNLAIDSLNFHSDHPEIPPIKDPLGNEIKRGQLGSKIRIPRKKRILL